MSKRVLILALLGAFITIDATAQNRTYRRRGVILGGLAGAAIGAAIGDKGDNETAGALIGGAVGAVAGGTIGNQKDQRIEHYRRHHSGQHIHRGHQQPYRGHAENPYPQYFRPYYVPQPPAPPHAGYPEAPAIAPSGSVPGPIAPEEVVQMVRNGLSESLIIDQIEILGIQRRLTVADVIRLHQQGVSEPILNTMQKMAPVPTSPDVIVKPTQSYRIPVSPGERLGPSVVAPSNGR